MHLLRRAALTTPIALAIAFTGSAAAAAPDVSFTKTGDWGQSFGASITIDNGSGPALRDWKLEFDLAEGRKVTDLWNASYSQDGRHVTVDPPPWNNTLPGGAKQTIGFNANGGGYAAPSGCKLNGVPCGQATPPPPPPPTTTTTPITTTPTTTTPAPPTTTTTPPSPTGGSAVVFSKTEDWDSGHGGQIVVTNKTSSTLRDWRLEFDLASGSQVSDLWGATHSQSGSHVVVSPPAWSTSLAPGASQTIGYNASGPYKAPSGCKLNGVACGSATPPLPVTTTTTPTTTTTTPTTTTPTTTTPTTTTTTPAPPPPVGQSGAGFSFAPYVDTTLTPYFDFNRAIAQTGEKHFSLGFIVGEGCKATWGTFYDVSDDWMGPEIASVRRAGGDVVISFGGAANEELARVCNTVDSLAREYQAVIDHYDLTHVDFDIEGAAIGDRASNQRRFEAIKRLRAHDGSRLRVSYTLPVLPTGLVESGLQFMRDSAAAGVRPDIVNVMAMDYGYYPKGGPAGMMGTYAIDSAESLKSQLAPVYPSLTDRELYAMVGVTPMIGVNDILAEVFTISDAQKVLDWAREKQVGRIAFWSANRDRACAGGAQRLDNNCSGTPQSEYGFTKLLGQFSG